MQTSLLRQATFMRSSRAINAFLPVKARLIRAPHLLRSHVPLVRTMTNSASAAAKPKSLKPVAYWLFGCSGMVFTMVVLGGATRLTRSGLSIVDWKPQGSWLPSTKEEWEKEFEKYKQFPEYKIMNQGMSLDDFKFIYFMEWFHRMWGRAIGIAFAVPFTYFTARGMLPRALWGRLGLSFGLGALQGGVGWWMVKSGLEEPVEDYSVPRVSPYRLTAHLTMAFAIYSSLVWTGLDILRTKTYQAPSNALLQATKRIRPLAVASAAVIGVTAFSGAFVAGNDAGHAYNDWPLFAGKWIPEEIWEKARGWRNFFENTATVQFDHRMLAYTSLGLTVASFIAARKAPWSALTPAIRRSVGSLKGLALAQVALGITTLMMYVPVSLGTAHQGGAMVLWTAALSLLHATSLTKSPEAPRMIARLLKVVR